MFCFISVGVLAVLRFLFRIKYLGQYKIFPREKLMKNAEKKNISQNIVVCGIV